MDNHCNAKRLAEHVESVDNDIVCGADHVKWSELESVLLAALLNLN